MGNINEEFLVRKVEKLLNEEVLPHNINKVKQLIDEINKIGYFKIDGEDISINKGFGTVSEQIDLQSLAEKFKELGFKVRTTHFQITVYGLRDFMENKNESLNESEAQIYNVEYNYGDGYPGLAIGHVKVRANSEEEALEKAEKYASNRHYRDDSYYIEDSCKIVKSGYSNDPIIESSQKNEADDELLYFTYTKDKLKTIKDFENAEKEMLKALREEPNGFAKNDIEKDIMTVRQWKNALKFNSSESSQKNEDYDDYDEDDYDDSPEEMHKERYVVYFETQEGGQKYTIYHVYTDSTDDSYNELCDKRDNQLGMYSSYKELKDALKEKAEKIAAKQGWTVKSIDNLGEDDEYYRERNKWESINEDWSAEDINKYNKERITKVKQVLEKQFKRLGFTDVKWDEAKQIYFFKYLDEPYYIGINTPGINGTGYDLYKADDYGVAKGRLLTYRDVWLMSEDVMPFARAVLSDIHKFILINESIKEGFKKGDKVQLKRKNNKVGIVKSIFNGDKDKNDKDIKYLDVEFEDGTKEGRPASDFKKANESVNEELKAGDLVDIYCTGQTRLDPKWFYNMTVDTVYDTHIAFKKENGRRYVVSKRDIIKVKIHNKNESVTYHFSVEDIGISGNNWVFPEEAYKEAKSKLGKLGYKVSDLTDDLEFTVIGDSTGVAYDGVIYSNEPIYSNESLNEKYPKYSAEDKQEIINQIKTILNKYGYKIDEIVPYGLNKGLWYCLDDDHTIYGDTGATYVQGKNYSEILKKVKAKFNESLNESVPEENLDEIYKVLDYYMTKLGFNLVEDRKPYFINKKYIKADNTNYIHFIDFTPQMDNDQLKYEVRDEKGHQKLCNTYSVLDAVDMDTSLQLIEFDMEGFE